jgi:prepilin-type N-terminal cleavage/methylation domain-containing protein
MMTQGKITREGDEAGFTLLELLVVLAIMGLIIGLISLRGSDRAHLLRLPQAAQNLAEELRVARAAAIITGQNVRFVPPHDATLSGSKQVIFTPGGAATAARFVWHDGARTLVVAVEPLSGRVEVQNASP